MVIKVLAVKVIYYVTSGTTSDNEWQQKTMSGSGGTTNENGTVNFNEWMIVILSMTKADTLLLQGMDGCN